MILGIDSESSMRTFGMVFLSTMSSTSTTLFVDCLGLVVGIAASLSSFFFDSFPRLNSVAVTIIMMTMMVTVT